MKPSDRLDANRQAIRDAVRRFNAANPRVFGSVARGEDREDSDLDILVDDLAGSTLLTLGGLHDTLERLLEGTSIHLLTPGDIPPASRSRILGEARPI
ncbi:nucleotidyltransferase family protein [Rhizobium sp. G21]|uniref:nucleotidyltransferase family protein n=1 Tax=Rhizobium sp. G21 TaxID=2758439 RepID=UPI001604717A|nr:nucleotidyltransferase family protein [Rhizobium sp. G21]MBB1248365.1 nucleotidyltransferase family protein [Rhizobium sp. G21]